MKYPTEALELLLCLFADVIPINRYTGHTPGQLMVLVNTEVGPIVLATDAIHVNEEMDRRMPFRHMCDIVAATGTYESIANLCAEQNVTHIIAGHEPSLVDQFPPHPDLPEYAITLASLTQSHINNTLEDQ